MKSTISGQYFDGESSTKQQVELNCTDSGQLSIEGIKDQSCPVSEVNISPRVGNTVRYIDFPDGTQFETHDNAAIDIVVNRFKPDKLHNLIFRLESAKKMVVASLAILIIGGALFIQYGIPYLSRELAMKLPKETSAYIGQGMLETLDEQLFEPSKLLLERQEELRQVFLELSMKLDNSGVRLEYRHSSTIGANAFALPNGVVVFTDQLINIAAENEEIAAIMLHELGHVEHRHILRKMIQSFSMTFFVMAVSGDVSTASSIIASAPLLFVQAGYSQDMEIEADTYSLNYMLAHDIEPNHFVTIMQKLENSHSSYYRTCMKKDDKDIQSCLEFAEEQQNSSRSGGRSFGSYLSTHPPTDERTSRFSTTKPD